MAYATARGPREDAADRARHVLEPLARASSGRRAARAATPSTCTACSSTATPTASSTRASRGARSATRARRAASSRCSRTASSSQASDQPQTLLATLEAVLESRKKSTGAASYTKSLYDAGAAGHRREDPRGGGRARARARVGERRARRLRGGRPRSTTCSSACAGAAIPLRRVLAELARRLGTSGHDEKASRATRHAGARGGATVNAADARG